MKTLVIHSTSFALFLVSTAILLVTWTLYILSGATISKVALWSNIIYLILSFISQCLLCAIFWVLSNQKIEEETPRNSIVSNVVVEYDEDAEL
jgi:hypothetical protein